jgi:hypothetical protein
MRMSNPPRIVYRQHPNVSPEDELNVLANVYAFIIRTHEAKAAEASGDRDDAKEVKGVRATPRISR